MLRVRQEQIEAFKKAALRGFEGEMRAHLGSLFPKHLEILGKPQFLKVIQHGVSAARRYGMHSRESVCMYICLTFTLGSSFDTDPLYPWATEILNDPGITQHSARAHRLYERAGEYLEETAGPESEHLNEALRNAREQSLEAWLRAPAGDFVDHVVGLLRSLYSQKYRTSGEANVVRLVRHGITSARNYGIGMNSGVSVYVSMMYLLGSGFDTDPQCPWATKVLNDPSITDPMKRISRLYQEAMVLLEKWMA